MYVQGTIASRISLCVNIDVSISMTRRFKIFEVFSAIKKIFFLYQKIYFLEIRILVISNNNGYFFISKNLFSKIRKIEYFISENYFLIKKNI